MVVNMEWLILKTLFKFSEEEEEEEGSASSKYMPRVPVQLPFK